MLFWVFQEFAVTILLVVTKNKRGDNMPRFWVSLGINENNEDEDSKSLKTCYQQLQELSNHGECFVTDDLDEAKEVARKAVSIWIEHGFKDFVYINTQPECPKCDKLARFSETYCNACGQELTPSEEIELE
jgi:hypothetical protein